MDTEQHLLNKMEEMSSNIKDLTVLVARLDERQKDAIDWGKKNTRDLEEHKKETKEEIAPLKTHMKHVEGAIGLGSVLSLVGGCFALYQRFNTYWQ